MSRPLIWHELRWRRPLDPVRVAELLRRWAADQRCPRLVLEVRLDASGVRYLLASPPGGQSAVRLASTVLPNLSLVKLGLDRVPVRTAGHLRANTRHRPLRLNDPEAIVRSILAPARNVRKDELLVLQVVLGPTRIPLAVPNASPSSVVQPWWSVAWMGNGGQIDGEKRQALRTKVSDFGFACTIRLGASAPSADRREQLLLALMAGLRTSQAPGVKLKFWRESAAKLNEPTMPWLWPLRLGIAELVGLTGWPLGDDDLPGQPAAHPAPLPAPSGTTGKIRVIADVADVAPPAGLALPADRALHHLHVIGPTGVGKSTLLANLITQDIAAGYGVVVIEPKGDLIEDVLARVPENRQPDLVILDPQDGQPVGLNPVAHRDRRPDLVADNLLTLFKQLYGKYLGPRSADILYAALLTLAQRDDASLVMLPLLLTNPGFRRSLTKTIRDPFVLEPFWATFDHWSDAERAAAIAPVMNKLRPLLRPGLRSVLGQREPRFAVSDVLTDAKLLLVPLRRGVIGTDASQLLGSLVVAELWQAIQARSSVPAKNRKPVMVYIDEAQNFLNLPTDLGDALAQARGYGVGFTLAHQLLEQFPRELRAGVLANARSRIAFQLTHDDARIFERGHGELTAADFEALGQYQVYASLFAHGRVQPYALGRTRPLGPKVSRPSELKRRSRDRYGQASDLIESGFGDLAATKIDLGPTGRKPRRSTDV